MAFKIKTYEDQARLSVILAAVGGFCTLAAVGFILRNFDASSLWTRYNPKSLFLPALLGAIGAALLAGAAGFYIAYRSAGQRRNKNPKLSWTGFFLNAVVITLALCVFVFFFFTRFEMEGG